MASAESSNNKRDLLNLRDLRARAACAAVGEWKGSSDRLCTHVKGLPVLVRRMGLAPAVALLANRTETRPLAENLASWLLSGHPGHPLGVTAGGVPVLLQRLTAMPSVNVRALEDEGLRFAEALKLFAGGIHGS